MARDLLGNIRVDELNPRHLLYLPRNVSQYPRICVERSADRHVQIKCQLTLVVCGNPVSPHERIERDCRGEDCECEQYHREPMIERPCQKPAILVGEAVEKSHLFD